MSNLAEAIQRLMEKNEVRFAVELARRTGIEEATISRWRNGIQISISDEDLEKLARAITSDPKQQAELVAARMRDVCHGPGAELVSVQIEERTLREEPQPYGQKKLPPKGRDTFNTLADEYISDGDLRDVLDGLANIIREKNLKPLAHQAGAKTPAAPRESPAPGKRRARGG